MIQRVCDFCKKEIKGFGTTVTIDNSFPHIGLPEYKEHHLHTECAIRVNNILGNIYLDDAFAEKYLDNVATLKELLSSHTDEIVKSVSGIDDETLYNHTKELEQLMMLLEDNVDTFSNELLRREP